MAQPFVLSASSLNTYLRCGKQWEYAYVMGVKAPPSLRASRGIALHAAVETSMRQKMTSCEDLPEDDWLDAYSDSYARHTADGYEAKSGESWESVKDAGIDLTKIYRKQAAPKIQPVLVEEPISFDINGQTWTGQIDLGVAEPINLWGEPEIGLRVRDTKSSARAPKPENYAVNMTGYAAGARIAGHKVAGVSFDYVIATNKPYYQEINQGPVTDAQMRSFAYLVGDVAANINKGAFPANGLNNPGVCDWCGFRAMCPAYKAKNPNI